MPHLDCNPYPELMAGLQLLGVAGAAVSASILENAPLHLTANNARGLHKMLGYAALIFLVYKAYLLFYGNCTGEIPSNPWLEKGIVGAGAVLGLLSVWKASG